MDKIKKYSVALYFIDKNNSHDEYVQYMLDNHLEHEHISSTTYNELACIIRQEEFNHFNTNISHIRRGVSQLT